MLIVRVVISPDNFNLKRKNNKRSRILAVYYAEVCNKLAGPISVSERPGNAASSEEMSQQCRAVGNAVSDLTGLKYEPQTSRSRDKRFTARPTASFEQKMKDTQLSTFFKCIFRAQNLVYKLNF